LTRRRIDAQETVTDADTETDMQALTPPGRRCARLTAVIGGAHSAHGF
jgi:hypothetical protein